MWLTQCLQLINLSLDDRCNYRKQANVCFEAIKLRCVSKENVLAHDVKTKLHKLFHLHHGPSDELTEIHAQNTGQVERQPDKHNDKEIKRKREMHGEGRT